MTKINLALNLRISLEAPDDIIEKLGTAEISYADIAILEVESGTVDATEPKSPMVLTFTGKHAEKLLNEVGKFKKGE